MCDQGNINKVYIFNLNKVVNVDVCIEPLVRALNSGCIEIHTVASCCGHGKRLGHIRLADGRELIVMPDYDTARQVEGCLKPIMSKFVSISDIRGCCSKRALSYCLTHENSKRAVIRCHRCHTTHFGPLNIGIIKPIWEQLKEQLKEEGEYES